MIRRRERRDGGEPGERGSVSILALGLLAICLLVVGVVVDLSALRLAHQRTLTTADATARAAAQALDLRRYYTGADRPGTARGQEGDRVLPLDSVRARQLALRYLADLDQGWRLEALRLAGGSVSARVSREQSLPFSQLVRDATVDVSATGSAQLRQLPQ